jgi:hypothetical protein
MVMPWSPTPRERRHPRPYACRRVDFHLSRSRRPPCCWRFSGLCPFSPLAYCLCARWPTHKAANYSTASKVSLPGGWLGLPGWASHPLNDQSLLGRFRLCPPRLPAAAPPSQAFMESRAKQQVYFQVTLVSSARRCPSRLWFRSSPEDRRKSGCTDIRRRHRGVCRSRSSWIRPQMITSYPAPTSDA